MKEGGIVSTQGGGRIRVDRQQVLDWLAQCWQGPRVCPICTSDDWLISESVLESIEYPMTLAGGRRMLSVPISCTTCGHTLFFDARTMGLLPGAEQ